jgi:hypothetical protein
MVELVTEDILDCDIKSQVYVAKLLLALMNKFATVHLFCSPNFSQGEKLLGDLGGLFSKKWKPKKNGAIRGPMLTRGNFLPNVILNRNARRIISAAHSVILVTN